MSKLKSSFYCQNCGARYAKWQGQCNKCNSSYDGCCSKDCKDFAALPIEEQRILRKNPQKVVSKSRYSSRIKPKLRELQK